VHRDGIEIALGGVSIYQQQLAHGFIVLLGFLAFVGKVLGLCWLQLTIRWTLPRFRYDQLMKLGWRMLLPASLINILVTGLVVLLVQASSETAQQTLERLAELTQGLVALGGLVAGAAFVLFILRPAQHKRLLSTTSAQFAADGTRRYPMGA
jgi:NADH-quinone oxidoreductase subunit H